MATYNGTYLEEQKWMGPDELAKVGQAPTASGFGFDWQAQTGLGRRYEAGSPQSQEYAKAAATLLGGAERMDAEMLQAYRDMYRARLGGAAAGQRAMMDSYGAEAAGQGLSGDVVRRLLAQGGATQAQQLGALSGELDAEYGAGRAALTGQMAQALAGLTLDEMKFGTQLDMQRRQMKDARNAMGIGAIGGILSAGVGGLASGWGLGMGLGGSGALGGGPFTGGGLTAPSGYNSSMYGAFSY
jgi:hypothetical protein